MTRQRIHRTEDGIAVVVFPDNDAWRVALDGKVLPIEWTSMGAADAGATVEIRRQRERNADAPRWMTYTDDQRFTFLEDHNARIEHRFVSGKQIVAGRVVADADVDWWEVTWNLDGDPKKPREGVGDSLRAAIDNAMGQAAVEAYG